jgi:hypothetical protein
VQEAATIAEVTLSPPPSLPQQSLFQITSAASKLHKNAAGQEEIAQDHREASHSLATFYGIDPD